MEAATAGSKAAEQQGEEEQISHEPMQGSTGQLNLMVGGEKVPTDSEVRLEGGSLALEGQFDLGEEQSAVVDFRFGQVHVVETEDRAGNIAKVTRRHIGKTKAVRRLTPALRRLLETAWELNDEELEELVGLAEGSGKK